MQPPGLWHTHSPSMSKLEAGQLCSTRSNSEYITCTDKFYWYRREHSNNHKWKTNAYLTGSRKQIRYGVRFSGVHPSIPSVVVDSLATRASTLCRFLRRHPLGWLGRVRFCFSAQATRPIWSGREVLRSLPLSLQGRLGCYST